MGEEHDMRASLTLICSSKLVFIYPPIILAKKVNGCIFLGQKNVLHSYCDKLVLLISYSRRTLVVVEVVPFMAIQSGVCSCMETPEFWYHVVYDSLLNKKYFR